MAKPGRNDPCPCGSGKKYKRCCLAKDEEAERALAAAAAPPPVWHIGDAPAGIADRFAEGYDEDTEYALALATASNAAVDLVHDGKLDDAEQAARDLLERFPDAHDGWDRLGMVYEARGDNQKAADSYRKVIDFIRAHPENYDPGFEEIFHKLVNRLDPSAPT
ncbi:MAG TPA: SEC-C metal-binding domain-containing protein [Casimicrobiaceae bacterium]|nr:SEC-C metal-binding domain-containing protein [Casimicrobiaceae bacterium]